MRRRTHLQPDNFPFLAVLLCAMGSLILILMELDRRARSNARARVEEAWKQQEQEKLELLTRMRAEREVERDALRKRLENERDAKVALHRAEQEQLRSQEQKLLDDQKRLQGQLQDLVRSLLADKAAQADEEARVEREKANLTAVSQTVAAKRGTIDEIKKRVETRRSEQESLTRDLLLIEEALARLKEQKKKQSKTWSVVPYVGKRGLNRLPMYVECDAEGLLFHPDKKRLAERSMTSTQILDEVKRRAKEFSAKPAASEKDREPYWMLLVKPDGIGAYYSFLTAVKAEEIAYGYEFVDAGWNFDFPDPSTLPPPIEVAAPLPTPKGRGAAGGSSPRPTREGNEPGTGGGPFQTTGMNEGQPAAQLLSPRTGGTGETGEGEKGGEGGGSGEGGKVSATVKPPGLERMGKGVEGSPEKRPPEQEPPEQRTSDQKPPEQGSPSAPESSSEKKGEAKRGPMETEPPKAIPEDGNGEERNGNGAAGGNAQSGSKTPTGQQPPRPVIPEWVLVVECRADGLKVRPTMTAIPLAELSEGKSGGALLIRTVKEQIVKRRELQRAGDPPVKIIIRFQVNRDGLRAFHLAYPLLDPFDVEKRAVLSGE